MDDDSAIVRCVNCEKLVRSFATEKVDTIVEGDIRLTERWCVGCLREVDANTQSLLQSNADYPAGLLEWDRMDDEDPDLLI